MGPEYNDWYFDGVVWLGAASRLEPGDHADLGKFMGKCLEGQINIWRSICDDLLIRGEEKYKFDDQLQRLTSRTLL